MRQDETTLGSSKIELVCNSDVLHFLVSQFDTIHDICVEYVISHVTYHDD